MDNQLKRNTLFNPLIVLIHNSQFIIMITDIAQGVYSNHKVQCSNLNVQCSKFKPQSSKLIVQIIKFNVQYSKFKG